MEEGVYFTRLLPKPPPDPRHHLACDDGINVHLHDMTICCWFGDLHEKQRDVLVSVLLLEWVHCPILKAKKHC